ncbi:Smr/MutS family protein [Ostreiculturibacter nitratireducens]|uniref:Smr/MutS family protein n=1 Tax=Ostreiculturibacter nitratireducens TaxID=3075226 RepID=UPI0031B56E4B
MTRKPRHLSPEERELWSRVASTAKAMHPMPQRPLELPDAVKPKKTRPEVKEFRIGQSSPEFPLRHDLAPTPGERLAQAPLRMDSKMHREMTRGKLKPEARIDLHGMTVSEAHSELTHFILRAHAEGKRLTLVITGKGKRGRDEGPIPQRYGVLRHQVPQWLALPPLGAVVLQVTEAHLRHGGSGAYYVYLRRRA